MDAKLLIIEKLNSGTDLQKDAMLHACENSVLDFATKDLQQLLEAFREVDPNKFNDAQKKQFEKLYLRVFAANLICGKEFDNIEICEYRGLELLRNKETGEHDGIKGPNGRVSCKILLWRGMEHYEEDINKLNTES